MESVLNDSFCHLNLGAISNEVSVHTSRTLMLRDLTLVLERVPSNAATEAYERVIFEENILSKPTHSTRARSSHYLTALYYLDAGESIFRLLRYCWCRDNVGRPMLAFLTATTRDRLLREMTPTMLEKPFNALLAPAETAEAIRHRFPDRFKPSTLLATAQRLASSWEQAGYLSGRASKRRVTPSVTPTVLTYALTIGYLSGFRGRSLFDTLGAKLLDRSPDDLMSLARDASKEGWLRFKEAGDIIEITFPELFAATRISM